MLVTEGPPTPTHKPQTLVTEGQHTHTLTHTHTHTHTHMVSHTHTHTHTHRVSHTHTHTQKTTSETHLSLRVHTHTQTCTMYYIQPHSPQQNMRAFNSSFTLCTVQCPSLSKLLHSLPTVIQLSRTCSIYSSSAFIPHMFYEILDVRTHSASADQGTSPSTLNTSECQIYSRPLVTGTRFLP